MAKNNDNTSLIAGHRAALQATDEEQRIAIIEGKAIQDTITLNQTGTLPDLLDPQALAIRSTKEYIEKTLMIGQGTILPQITALVNRKLSGGNLEDVSEAVKAYGAIIGALNKAKTPFIAVQFNNNGATGGGLQHLKRSD